jgi:hypothetical protein
MISYKPFQLDYLHQVLVLLEPLWGHLTLQEREAYFTWKYINNPCTEKSSVFVALNSAGEIIGCIGFFVMKYQKNNKKIVVSSYSDASVADAYRGQNIFKNLTLFSMKELQEITDLYLTTSNNSWTSTNTFIKIGSEPLANKNVFYKFNTFALVFKKKSLRIELSNKFNRIAFTSFYEKHHDPDKIKIPPNLELWEWRYSNPISKYKFVYLWNNDDLIGFLSYYKINKYRAFVLDCYFDDLNDLKYALNEMRRIDTIYLSQLWTISKSKDQLSLLIKQGFFGLDKISNWLKKEPLPPVLIRPGANELTSEDWLIDGQRITEPTNWNINLICSDGI